MTVEEVMARTGLSRPAFYAYFRDRYDLVTRLLEGIAGLLFAVDQRWLAGGADEGREEASEVLAEALRRGAETFARNGPVLRAISDAATQDVGSRRSTGTASSNASSRRRRSASRATSRRASHRRT